MKLNNPSRIWAWPGRDILSPDDLGRGRPRPFEIKSRPSPGHSSVSFRCFGVNGTAWWDFLEMIVTTLKKLLGRNVSTATPTKQMCRGCSRWPPWGEGGDGGNPLSHGLQPVPGICGRHQDLEKKICDLVCLRRWAGPFTPASRLNLVNRPADSPRKSGAGRVWGKPREERNHPGPSSWDL